VFRYALERWPADPYRVTIFHKGPLSREDRVLVEALEKSEEDKTRPANIEVYRVDLAGKPDEEMRELFQAQKKPQLPWVVIRYPKVTRIEDSVWTGRLSADVVKTLLDSPCRRELAKRLLAGETAVWVMLESGQKEKDEAAAKLLQAELQRLPKVLKLPPQTDAPEDKTTRENLPLRLAFSLLRVGRNDPAEKLFVQMLLHSEDDLSGRTAPMAFPVFGRGRALYALVGAGITAENIEEASAFLVGPCSCRVKAANPGVDLLMTVDWDSDPNNQQAPKRLEPEQPSAVGELVPILRASVQPSSPESQDQGEQQTCCALAQVNWLRFGLMAGAGFAGLLVLATGTWLFWSWKQASGSHDR